jgi:hypothetical protein
VLLLCDYFCAFSGTVGINHKQPSANGIIPPVLDGRLPGITKSPRSFMGKMAQVRHRLLGPYLQS